MISTGIRSARPKAIIGKADVTIGHWPLFMTKLLSDIINEPCSMKREINTPAQKVSTHVSLHSSCRLT